VTLLALVGIVITVIVWTRISWVWGLVTGFLLVGGLGWRILASGAGAIVRRRNRGMDEFVEAWESRVGEMRFGQPDTYPPPGVYQAWREAYEREEISAGDYLDRLAERMKAPKAHALISGVFETVGRWEGEGEAHPEGVLVTGEHIWWESDVGGPEESREHREMSETILPWDQITSATLTGNGLDLRLAPPSMFVNVMLTDFDDQDPEPWLELVERNGITLERKTGPWSGRPAPPF
jgi:hypothetical protein